MEPIGLAASLVTLAKTTGYSINFLRSLHRAPSEIQQVRRHVRHLRSAMDLRLDLYTAGYNTMVASPHFSPDRLRLFEVVLGDAREVLGDLEQSLMVFNSDTDKTSCVRWVIQNRAKITNLSEHVQQLEQTTMNLLMITLTSLALTSHGQLNEINVRQRQILDWLKDNNSSYPTIQMSARTKLVSDTRRPPQLAQLLIDADQQQPKMAIGSCTSNVCGTLQNRASSTLYMILQSRRDKLRTIYRFLGLFRLPFFLSAYAISVKAKLTRSFLHWPHLSYFISIKNIVPIDSEFMTACDLGNFEQARDIALAGQGSPTDVDENGLPALHKAIWSGSYELTEFLLENGASANEVDGALHQSALQVACKLGLLEITRLLMSKGACADYVDSGGLTAVASLWHMNALSFSRVDLLKVMLAYSSLPIRPSNNNFCNPVFQVAAHGSARDMKTLLELGADIHSLDMIGINIMEYCIYGCNMDTFDYLSNRLPVDWIHQRDFRGRTALHHCFQSPNPSADILAERLIKLGADIYAVDGEGLTVGEIAKETDFRHNGIQVWKTGTCQNHVSWLKALRSVGRDVNGFQ